MLSRKRLGGMLWDLNPTDILYLLMQHGAWSMGPPRPLGGRPGHPWAPHGTHGSTGGIPNSTTQTRIQLLCQFLRGCRDAVDHGTNHPYLSMGTVKSTF